MSVWVWEGEGRGILAPSRNGPPLLPPLAAARKSAAPNTESRFPLFLLGKQDIFSEETQEASSKQRQSQHRLRAKDTFWVVSLSLVSRNWDGWMRGACMVAKDRVTKFFGKTKGGGENCVLVC